MKIIVAEDDRLTQRSIAMGLEGTGHELSFFTNGAQALAAIRTLTEPAILILDWMMPGLSGPELCQKIQEENRKWDKYVIMLSSKSAREDITQGLESGADDYLTKPFYKTELVARLMVAERALRTMVAVREHN